MPRDVNGNYTLPAGLNPVVADTLIDILWANTTLNDIATQLNGVFTRDGLLGPQAPFKVLDGTLSVPGLAFNSEANTGMFREAAGVMSLVSAGTKTARLSVPTLSFYTQGTERLQVGSTGVVSVLPEGTAYEVGFRNSPFARQIAAGAGPVSTDRGMTVELAGSLQLNVGVMQAGSVVQFINFSGASIATSVGMGMVLRWGGGAGALGNRNIANGGVFTIWWKTNDSAWIWGTGLT